MAPINLSFPYSGDWDWGYLLINSEPRRLVALYGSTNRKRSSVSYARYLMACKLGRYLTNQEVVDHINNNRLDDRIENLQILTPKDNAIKSNKPPTRIHGTENMYRHGGCRCLLCYEAHIIYHRAWREGKKLLLSR